MLITVRIFGIGPDVFLDERRKRGLRQVLVTVNSGVDKQIARAGRFFARGPRLSA